MARGQSREKAAGNGKSRLDLPAVLFDLDGTLVDSNYHHVAAWSAALRSVGLVVPMWKIHRRIGMSGKSFLPELLREISHGRKQIDIDQLERKHEAIFRRGISRITVLPGVPQLVKHFSRNGIAMAIATTGGRKPTLLLLSHVKLPREAQIVTGDDVEKAKPAPDIFVEAARRLHRPLGDCIVVGDSVWDMLAASRKSALGVGFLSGGYGQQDLERAGAFRVYSDAADMLMHLEQLGLPGIS